MMSQENYVNINDLHQQGWTILEIAEATGWHRTTVSNYLKNGPPPATRATEATVMTEHWQQRISTMLESWPRLQSVEHPQQARARPASRAATRPLFGRCATSVAHGSGRRTRCRCRSTPTRARKPSSTSATCRRGRRRIGWKINLVCFGMILSWSRYRMWWFTTVGGSASHLRRHRPVLRRDRWCSDGVSHRSDGSARPIAGSPVRAASADGRVRGASRDEDHLVSGRRRETQRQGRAAVPVAARDVPARGRIRRHPDRSRRLEPASRGLARRTSPRASSHARPARNRPTG